tara:strand:+ start:404 stop:985 length:582 start_codon:yes stop_codon:yes gene_type:complete
MNNLRLLVNSKFNKVIKISCLINSYENDNLFHNYYRLKKGFPKGNRTYNGSYHCGVTSFVLGNLLKNEDINIKMYKQESGYGKYKEDHVFLKYDDLIIDTTYKQFFTNNLDDCTSDYHNYLYGFLPPFFVGTKDDLNKLYDELKLKSLNYLKYQTFDDIILEKWDHQNDITNQLQNFDNIYNKKIVIDCLFKN